jgi:hypothetical protein
MIGQAKYWEEISKDADSVLNDSGNIDAASLNSGEFCAAALGMEEVEWIAETTTDHAEWADATICHSHNIEAVEEMGISVEGGARKVIGQIAYFAYRADLLDALRRYSAQDVAPRLGYRECDECGEWHKASILLKSDLMFDIALCGDCDEADADKAEDEAEEMYAERIVLQRSGHGFVALQVGSGVSCQAATRVAAIDQCRLAIKERAAMAKLQRAHSESNAVIAAFVAKRDRGGFEE